MELACDVKSGHHLGKRAVEIEVQGRKNRAQGKMAVVRDDIR